METSNINNPKMLSDVTGKPVIKGAFLSPDSGMVIKMRPFIIYLPNGRTINRNISSTIDCNSSYPSGGSTVVTTPGMYRWVTIVLAISDDGNAIETKVYAGEQNTDADVKKPDRGSFIHFKDSDVIVGDVRLYNGMTKIVAEDIDMSRAEAANYIDPTLIPVEVYGPPLNQYGNVEEVIQAINSGAMDYRYIKKDGADYIKFNTLQVCNPCETAVEQANAIPPGAKREGAVYFVHNVATGDKFLATNFGPCASCDGVVDANEGVKKIVVTDPPAGFCGATCDVACDAGNDVVPCLSCDGTNESFCGLNCQTGCEVVCDAGSGNDTAGACGSNCQVACESSFQTFCQVTCQIQCEIDLQTAACVAVCEISCQSGYQTQR